MPARGGTPSGGRYRSDLADLVGTDAGVATWVRRAFRSRRLDVFHGGPGGGVWM